MAGRRGGAGRGLVPKGDGVRVEVGRQGEGEGGLRVGREGEQEGEGREKRKVETD